MMDKVLIERIHYLGMYRILIICIEDEGKIEIKEEWYQEI